jgi:hypothetical protein
MIVVERMSATKCTLLGALLLSCTSAFAQSPDKMPKEVAVVELGGAAERSLTEGNSSFGPTVAVEFTPIENWLELEAGVTPLFRRHSTEWSTDLLFKKTLDSFLQNGVYAWRWPRVDSHQRIRQKDELGWYRSRARFHVLALKKAQIRMVSRTRLRL